MKPIVVKIGGSTLGSNDTTLEDLVALQKQNVPLVVVHGGGKAITEWLTRMNVPTVFVEGLRVTDMETLKVVTAVLCGLVNKDLVSGIWKLGGKAMGFSGADGSMIMARNINPSLGYTGEQLTVNITILHNMLKDGYIPVIAPVCLGLYDDNTATNLINVNGDTVAAELAAALDAEKLVFLTDVPGLYDGYKNLIERMTTSSARELIDSGVVSGGMVAKIKACMSALCRVRMIRIIDGKMPHALLDEIEGKCNGTTIVSG